MRKRIALLILVLSISVSGSRVGAQEVLSLEGAIDRAVDVSTAVGQSRQQLQQYRQNVLASWGGFLPDLTMNSYAGHRYIGPTGSVSFDQQGRPVVQTGFDFESYSFGFNSSIMLFDFLANVKTLQGAKHNAKGSEFALEFEKDRIAFQVVQEYYNLVRDEYLILVANESVNAAQRNLDQVEAFFAIGSNTKADVLQAKVRLGNTELEQIVARNSAEISRASLASTLNLPINRPLQVDTSLAITTIDPDLEAEVAYMLEHRPDLLGTQRSVEAAGDYLAASKSRRWPTLAASWFYTWNDRTFPPDANFFIEEYSWAVGISLNWNVFDRYQTKSSILNAKAEKRIAELTYKQAKLDAILQVKTVYVSLKEAEERARVSRQTTDQGKENLRLAEERYRVGAGTILETNDAQVQLTRARAELVRALTDYLISRANLQLVTGRPVKMD
jgi:outer membrane protein TolC